MNDILTRRLTLANDAMIAGFSIAPEFRRHLSRVAQDALTEQYESIGNDITVRVEAEFRTALSVHEQCRTPNFICQLAFDDTPSSECGIALIALSVLWEVVTKCGTFSDLRDEIEVIVRNRLGLAEHELGSEVSVAWLEALSGMRIVSEVETSL
jgi:hypothetical protein